MTEASVRHPDKTVTVATFGDYLTAQRAVDYLSDNKFPVHVVSIIGEDVRLVERVLGRCDRGPSESAPGAAERRVVHPGC